MSAENKHYDPAEQEPLPEGEEAPPPLTHTMAIIRWVILVGMSIFALIMILHYFGVTPTKTHTERIAQYHCPMHPTYVSNQPGDCPICGMTLVPIAGAPKIKAVAAKPEVAKQPIVDAEIEAARYVCPMDPEIISSKPGKCSKCGMDLVAIADTTRTSAADKPARSQDATEEKPSQATKYVCSMCPDVMSDKPGKCPKCGMDLVPAPGPVGALPDAHERGFVEFVHALEGYLNPGSSIAFAGDTSMSKPMEMPMPESAEQAPAQEPQMQNLPGMTETAKTAETGDLGEAPVPGLVPVVIEPERLQLINIRTGRVEKRDLGGMIDIVGFVTPDETHMRSLHVRVSGWVLDLFADKTGQFVKVGEPLMSLYSQDLYQAEQDFVVARDAYRKSGAADSALVAMRGQLYDAARERLRLLGLSEDEMQELEKSELPSSQMTLRSPFSGYVLEKSVYQGQYLSPDQNLFTIADLSTVWVLGDVYEKDIPFVHEGQKASMRLAAFPGEEFDGAIGFIYPSISEKTRTMKVRLQFSDPGMRFRPGMYAEVEIQRDTGKTLAVPAEAVMAGGDGQYVFVVHDRTHFEPRLIRIGSSSDDWVQVLTGLKEGEEVVTSANFLIDSESRLKAAIAGMGAMPGMEGMSGTEEKSLK